MTQARTILELETVATVTPVEITREEKLMHWASIVRAAPSQLELFNGLEHWNAEMLKVTPRGVYSAFAIAAADPKFREAGLTDSSVWSAMRFFGLTQHQLHSFSCDCGGAISNEDQAHRIERLAV